VTHMKKSHVTYTKETCDTYRYMYIHIFICVICVTCLLCDMTLLHMCHMSVDESIFSPRTCFVDLFTPIARVFLDSP